ncbi:SCO2322 family protein [Nonomuraea fuscirosea]|uniref:SCO2322 family protein n=1 Tax=Nonomuraea fuscirosea TaxID=1291556 RepID=UPI0034230371
MLRAYRVAAGVALGAAAFLALPLPALASPPVAPGGPAPGAADPGATRSWSAWRSDGTAWLAADPADSPPDGSVIGWRFSVSPEGAGGAAGDSPGGELPSFASVCGRDTAASGHKRVAVTVDFGDGDADAYPGDQPPAQGVLRCVAGAEDATTARLLASAAQVRVNDRGDVVSVSGYPMRERGGTELTAAAPAAPDGPPGLLIAGGAGALALLTAGAVVATRRGTRAPAQTRR